MANIAVVNAIGLGATAQRPLAGGPSSLERSIAFARELPGVTDVVLLASRPLPGAAGLRTVHRDSWTVRDLLAALGECAGGREDLWYLFADCPLLDRGVAERMQDSHRRYFAEYTFADGWPIGIAGELLRAELPARLLALAGEGGEPPGRGTLFEVIRRDINAFDVETELAPKDLRMLRASLTADCERNAMVVEQLIRLGATAADAAVAAIEADPAMLRTLPAFCNVQIVERCPQSCSYCPWPAIGGDPRQKRGLMPVERFSLLLDRVLALCHDAVISVSLWGEPSLHPEIAEIVEAAARRPGLRLLVETSGIGWRPETLERIAGLPRAGQPTWVVSLDAAGEAVYRTLRGEGYAEAHATVERLLKLFPDATYVQAVRMRENEEDLEGFWKSWRARTERVIVQKYDHCCGLLPQRRVADLTPVNRFPCWHLRRDLSVRLDGSVALCREDLEPRYPLGNVFAEDLADIWGRGGQPYARHVAGDLPALCAACDEYYTYNF